MIGLGTVSSAPDRLGITSHDTPWLGAMLNHCNRPNVRLVDGGTLGFPGQTWIQAIKQIGKGEELTLDYEEENQRFPDMVMKPDLSWTCAASGLDVMNLFRRFQK